MFINRLNWNREVLKASMTVKWYLEAKYTDLAWLAYPQFTESENLMESLGCGFTQLISSSCVSFSLFFSLSLFAHYSLHTSSSIFILFLPRLYISKLFLSPFFPTVSFLSLPFFLLISPSSWLYILFNYNPLSSILSLLSLLDVTSRITSGTRALAASRWWPSSRWCVWPWVPRLWWSCCSSWSLSALPRSSTCSRQRTRSCASAGKSPSGVWAKWLVNLNNWNYLIFSFLSAEWFILPRLGSMIHSNS